MNDFMLYHSLCNLYAQAEPFAANQPLVQELKRLTEQFSSKSYRIAVIGEFKRGKSSLINALLGTEILPTDILPTTAVINRIRFSLDQKIVIYFKNGEVQESSIESLAEYATKLDKNAEEFAQTIREIVVHYPSVFGQNHFEIIDTPGLNDNEAMTETTLNILGSIDTAIVVISATIPLSLTEQNLIRDLIRQADVYNLVFAVTFIDRVSDEEDEQDRVVELIKNRLSEDTFQHFCQSVEDAQLREKAKRILSQPNVYAVSSKQAIQGFIKGRNDLIEKSRFKRFKYHLSALLTANQEKDRLLKTKRISSQLEKQIPKWFDQYFRCAEEEMQARQTQCAQWQALHGAALAFLNRNLLDMDDEAQKQKDALLSAMTDGMPLDAYLGRFFIRRLSALTWYDYNEASVQNAIELACADANGFMETGIQKLTAQWDTLSETTFQTIKVQYEEALCRLHTVPASDLQPQVFPGFALSGEAILAKMRSWNNECMPAVQDIVAGALAEFQENLEDYLAAHRLVMIRYYKEVKAILENAITACEAEVAAKNSSLQNERIVAKDKQLQIGNTILEINGIVSECLGG